jgi:hypothetical protein
MKSPVQKLKKLKTKQVYGFGKGILNNSGNGDPTLTSTACTTGIMLHAQL